MNSMKRQKDRTLKDELPRSIGAQYATGEEWRNNSRKNEGMEPKQKQHPVVNGFRKGRGTRDQITNIHWIIKKAREFQKNIYFCFIDYAKAFDYVDHNKLWKILKEMGIPDHLTCLLRNLYAGQEATVRTGHATSDWFQ